MRCAMRWTRERPINDNPQHRQPLLDVRDLRVGFGGRDVVHGIDFHIAPGEKLALVGESGSGKTVSALSLLRLVHNAQVSGTAHLNGRDLLGLSERELRGVRGDEVAIIFQEPMTALNPLYSDRQPDCRGVAAQEGAHQARRPRQVWWSCWLRPGFLSQRAEQAPFRTSSAAASGNAP